jgi:glycine cleavage system aminomethyltransferase T
MSTDVPLRSSLYDLHVAAGAVMKTAAGWELPAHYGDVQSEVAAARQSAVVTDVSHWGRIRIRGSGAAELLVRLGAADALRQEDDTVRAVDLRDAAGGTIDRARLVRLEEMWLLLTTPAARTKVLSRAVELAADVDAKVDDQTSRTAMIACLGPQAAVRLDAVLPITVSDLSDGSARTGSVLIAKYIALHSDVVGVPRPYAASAEERAPGHEDETGPRLWRMEVILPGLLAGKAWRFITQKAAAHRMPPIGTEAMEMLLEK